jgi:DNA-directed RNA polymerase specialized sigma24 family protein
LAVPASALLSRVTASQLLRTSQSTGPESSAACELLVERFGRLLKKLTAQTCRRYHLSDQERDEVLAETYQQLLNPDIARYKPCRGKPQHYFRGLVQNAARKILTQVGARRRQHPGVEEPGCRVDETPKHGGDGVLVSRHLDKAVTASPGVEAEVKDLAAHVLEQAPPHLRRALELCYWDDRPIKGIATQLGMSRFTLTRELDRFFARMGAELKEISI